MLKFDWLRASPIKLSLTLRLVHTENSFAYGPHSRLIRAYYLQFKQKIRRETMYFCKGLKFSTGYERIIFCLAQNACYKNLSKRLIDVSQFLGTAHLRRPLQKDDKYHLQHLVIWLLIHLTLYVTVLMLVRSQSSPYERLHILIKKYCSERVTQDLSDTHLYSSLCNSFHSNPPTNNQPFQKFIHSGTTARFYFKSEVILVLKKDAVNVKVEITPISGSLAEKKGWHSAGPSVDIVVSSGNSKIELVGLPHMLSQQTPRNEIKIFHQPTENEPIDQFDVLKLLKFHLFYKPGLRFSPSDPGTNNTRNILPLTTIDLPVFRKEGQPEKVQIAPIPQNEAAFYRVLNWLKQDGFELESSNSPCTYPEHNDSFGFWKKRFALQNDYEQLIAKPTKNILILDPVDSLNRSRIHLRQLSFPPYDGEFFYLSLLQQNTEINVCDKIDVKSSLSLSVWESSITVRSLITMVISGFCFLTGLCLEGLMCNYFVERCGRNCLAKCICCSLLLAVIPCCFLLKSGDYPQGKINLVIYGSICFFSAVIFIMVAFLIWYYQLFHFSIPASVYLSTLSLWKWLFSMVAGFYVLYGFGIVPEHRLNKLRDATDALLRWYYFPYYIWPLVVLLFVIFISNVDRIDGIYHFLQLFAELYLWPRLRNYLVGHNRLR